MTTLTKSRQVVALRALGAMGPLGATIPELAKSCNLPPAWVEGILTTERLSRTGTVRLLPVRRKGWQVYILVGAK